MELKAYALEGGRPLALEPAPLNREWTAGNQALSAARHPAMARANQAGWVVPSPVSFRVMANGDPRPNQGLEFFSDDPLLPIYAPLLSNHFGHGILTLNLTHLFRTPPGMGLLVRGVPNTVTPNLHPLDGLVETDWLEATFTMNWLVLNPGYKCGFQRGEPMCLIQPFPLDMLEETVPSLAPPEPAPIPDSVAFKDGGVWQNAFADPGAATAPGKLRMRLRKFR